MPSSFRNIASLRPLQYRTPSPPRSAYEPVSPARVGNSQSETLDFGLRWPEIRTTLNARKRPFSTTSETRDGSNKTSQAHEGSMDAFASIALATKPALFDSTATSTLPLIDYETDRPAKRARSERLQPPEMSRKEEDVNTRPDSGHEPEEEERRQHAELLLNFAQEAAKLLTPSPKLSRSSIGNARSILDASRQESCAWASYHAAEGAPQLRHGEKLENRTACTRVTVPGFASVRADHRYLSPLPGKIPEATPAPPIVVSNSSQTVDDTVNLEGFTKNSQVIDKLGNIKSSLCYLDEQLTQGQEIMLKSISQSPDQPEPCEPARQHTPIMDDALQLMDNAIQTHLEDQERGPDLPRPPYLQEPPEHHQKDAQHHEPHASKGALRDETTTPVTKSNLDLDGTEKPSSALGLPADSTNDAVKSDTPLHMVKVTAVCAACKFSRNSIGVESESSATSWISCDACKDWFHFACAGFKNEREVRSVDKFRCKKCKPMHGATTYVRKSSRAHSAIDYASLHQGAIKTSDDRPEHHYIKPIKDGTITFLPENFARMRPELTTAEFFEKGIGMKEPVVIPAALNPRPAAIDPCQKEASKSNNTDVSRAFLDNGLPGDEWPIHPEAGNVQNHGQDALDMIVPQGLTVRQVAELYGPEEKVEVIDVKSQNGEKKTWNMRKWADYYEDKGNKVVRNVISLEVSQSKLGRLIRRPKIVRDLDLQDSVWPKDLLASGQHPRVQFYCLMSVADCFTDFHIDFGGSSVFYHILQGKKTFLFIPPKEKNLKKYEEWCMSPAQNWTFLGDQTKECYRVDLSEGDTMLIPAGWIHAVWTPEDSLVIGGNFLTRMNYAMQLRVAQIEKNTGVSRKFRYPSFQKLHWFTVLQYLDTDPLPSAVKELLHSGHSFHRERPGHLDFDAWGENSRDGYENYHARYYSQSELDGLPDLTRYVLRTALIDIGNILDGVSADTRKAVTKSIPRNHNHGEPFEVVKKFAAWCAWKRGNEPVPHWAYPDALPENLAPDKLSAAATKKLDREAALAAPRRHSARTQSQVANAQKLQLSDITTAHLNHEERTPFVQNEQDTHPSRMPKRFWVSPDPGASSSRKTACESCRKRRRACKHKEHLDQSSADPNINGFSANPDPAYLNDAVGQATGTHDIKSDATSSMVQVVAPHQQMQSAEHSEPSTHPDDFSARLKNLSHDVIAAFPKPEHQATKPKQPRPRTKACDECRKNKRRCIHDPWGNEDPVKVHQDAIPRPYARKASIQAKLAAGGSSGKKRPRETPIYTRTSHTTTPQSTPGADLGRRLAPVASMVAPFSREDSDSTHQTPADASLWLDPALRNETPSKIDVTDRTAQLSALSQLPQPALDQMDASSKMNGAKRNPVAFESRESYEQTASSLVSPPASSHEDANHSPPRMNENFTPEVSTSRQSSKQPEKHQEQRYTPESGPLRRASSSPREQNKIEKNTLSITQQSQDRKERSSTSRLGSDTMADEESMKLIKELQVQEHGLRRRGRMPW